MKRILITGAAGDTTWLRAAIGRSLCGDCDAALAEVLDHFRGRLKLTKQ
ncbi:hypothetical protein MKK70_24550 [Methylobacterium sp. E-041]|nr:hypothetical protein [Methylobacterium sp. E-041]MCJ2108484.1 hypothetical protein [Methylobacterium sp. E-041]